MRAALSMARLLDARMVRSRSPRRRSPNQTKWRGTEETKDAGQGWHRALVSQRPGDVQGGRRLRFLRNCQFCIGKVRALSFAQMLELEVYAAGVRDLNKILELDHEFETIAGLRYKVDRNHDWFTSKWKSRR